MPKYVISREIDGGVCFLCTAPRENPHASPDMYWGILELPIKHPSPVIVFASEIEAYRIKGRAPRLDPHCHKGFSPSRITLLASVSDDPELGDEPTTCPRTLTCASFDWLPPDVQVYAALQVLVAEVNNKYQIVSDDRQAPRTFDRHLIEVCEAALSAYRASLGEGAKKGAKKGDCRDGTNV